MALGLGDSRLLLAIEFDLAWVSIQNRTSRQPSPEELVMKPESARESEEATTTMAVQ